MASIKKFLFETDFDQFRAAGHRVAERRQPEPEPEPEPLPDPEPEPPPMFTEEELATAREHAFESGRVAGIQEAESATQRMAATALASISGHLREVQKHQIEAHEALSVDAVRLAMTVLRKVVPEMARRGMAEEIEALVLECVAHLLDEPRIVVKVNETILAPVRERLEEAVIQAGYEGRLVLSADNRLRPGDCRVEWGDGGAERDTGRLWQDIEAIIGRALGETAPADASEAAGML